MLFHEPLKIVTRYISVVISNFKIEKQKQTFRKKFLAFPFFFLTLHFSAQNVKVIIYSRKWRALCIFI